MRIIAGEWGGRRIQAPPGRKVRPTSDRVREAWMSILAPRLQGARVLDLFAGSGALGLEALSRGAREVVFVERSRGVLRVLRRNVELLDAGSRSRVVEGDALRHARGLAPLSYDLALADPPYDQGMAAALLEVFSDRAFAGELWVEHRTSEALPALVGLRHRRYGDTMLTMVPPPDPPPEEPGGTEPTRGTTTETEEVE